MFIDQVVSRRWNVKAKPPFASPAGVLLYIGRYTHRVAISNYRIQSIGNGEVAFEYKDNKNGGVIRTMTLPAEEFIRRFLLHVLPYGYHKIRMYGFWTNSGRARNIERARRLILGKRSILEFKDEVIERIIQSMSDYIPNQRPVCGEGAMINKDKIAPKGHVYIEVANTS